MKKLFPLFLLSLLLLACGILKDEPKPKVTAIVITGEVSDITPSSARASGEVVTDGNPVITERGFVYGTVADPTTAGATVTAGTGKGVFSAEITSLTPGTTYHIRAYATNAVGTAYGEDRTFTTGAAPPTLTTNTASALTAVSLTTGGSITSDGGAAITARGVCWNTTGSPTIADNKTSDGVGLGNFTSTLNKLPSNSKIYVRAYASNSAGTEYGNQIEISTKKAVPADGLVGWWPFNGNANDESGNGYNGVVNSATLTSDRFGNINASYDFNGASSIVTTYKGVSSQGSRTISLWLKQNFTISTGSGQVLLVYGGPNIGQGFALVISNLQFPGIDLGASYVTYDYNLSDTWHLFTITYDRSNGENVLAIKIYIDGILLTSINGQYQSSTTLVTGNSIDLMFGNSLSPGQSFGGKLDDIGFWNRVLTAEEILKIYNSTGF